jgi:ATP-dependent DNA helicase RecQ
MRKSTVLLTSPSDIMQAENQFIHIPSRQTFLNKMYVKLYYFQIAYGEGIHEKIHLLT